MKKPRAAKRVPYILDVEEIGRLRAALACPLTQRGVVSAASRTLEANAARSTPVVRLRHIPRRALREAGLPPLRFHDLRHMAGTLMHEAGVPLERAQAILGHASERTALAIAHMRRSRDDSADKIAALARLSDLGNKRETIDSVERAESELSDCFSGSPR